MRWCVAIGMSRGHRDAAWHSDVVAAWSFTVRLTDGLGGWAGWC